MEREQPNFLVESQQEAAEELRPRRRGRSCLILLIVFLVLLGSIGIARMFAGSRGSDDPLAYNPVTLEPKSPQGFFQRLTLAVFTKDTTLAGEKDDRINILLLGMGGLGHDGPYLTDTMMIASIKPSTKQVALISIPRDMAVPVPDHGIQKINSVNSLGETKKANWGGAYTTEVLRDVFATDIPYYIRIDFKAFAEIIDAVGGVKVTVDRSFTDETYPADHDEYQTVSFRQGEQTMHGATALIYARSRHGNNGEGSDFARARRQQKVILALKEKVLSFETLSNPVKIHDIMASVDAHLTTNMTFPELIALLKIAKSQGTEQLTSLVFDDAPNGFLKSSISQSGAFILSPVTGNFDSINDAIAHVFEKKDLVKADTTPVQDQPKLAPATIEIQNGTWSAGLAARMKKRLEDKGFTVVAIGNTTVRPQSRSGIYKQKAGAPKEVVSALITELKIPESTAALPEDITPTSKADILVILGDDMQE